MLSYSTPIGLLARYLSHHHVTSPDSSVQLLLHIAHAYRAARSLYVPGEQTNAMTEIIGELERLYNKAVLLRSRLPAEHLDTSFISRFGRAQIEDKN